MDKLALWATLAIAGVMLWPTLSGSSAHAADGPRFEPTTCHDLPDIANVLPRLRCGVVRVPRDYTRPGGPTFALAVVVIAAARQPASADPVGYISG